jgi:hypothetical protein
MNPILPVAFSVATLVPYFNEILSVATEIKNMNNFDDRDDGMLI